MLLQQRVIPCDHPRNQIKHYLNVQQMAGFHKSCKLVVQGQMLHSVKQRIMQMFVQCEQGVDGVRRTKIALAVHLAVPGQREQIQNIGAHAFQQREQEGESEKGAGLNHTGMVIIPCAGIAEQRAVNDTVVQVRVVCVKVSGGQVIQILQMTGDESIRLDKDFTVAFFKHLLIAALVP
ncbi:hypothetical protein D3C71_1589490 [compost metagenome]